MSAEAGSADALLPEACTCLIGMEACGTRHHSAREMAGLHHTARVTSQAIRDAGQDRRCRCAGDQRSDRTPDHELSAENRCARFRSRNAALMWSTKARVLAGSNFRPAK